MQPSARSACQHDFKQVCKTCTPYIITATEVCKTCFEEQSMQATLLSIGRCSNMGISFLTGSVHHLYKYPASIFVQAVFAQVIALIMDSTPPLTCEPVIPDARRYVSCRHNLRCHKVLLSAVHLHSIVALDEHNAEEEAADHLSEQHKQHCLGQWELTEHKPKVPAIMYQQASQLIPPMLLTLHKRRCQFHACTNKAYNKKLHNAQVESAGGVLFAAPHWLWKVHAWQ